MSNEVSSALPKSPAGPVTPTKQAPSKPAEPARQNPTDTYTPGNNGKVSDEQRLREFARKNGAAAKYLPACNPDSRSYNAAKCEQQKKEIHQQVESEKNPPPQVDGRSIQACQGFQNPSDFRECVRINESRRRMEDYIRG